MDDIFSAIDDSGATFIVDASPPAPSSSTGTGPEDPVTFEYGRQSGHWTAEGIVLGSEIHNGIPTVMKLPHHFRNADEGDVAGHVLNGAALKSLEIATREEEKGRAAAAALGNRSQEKKKAAVPAVEWAKAGSVAKGTEHPKAFNLPKSESAGIKIVSKDGKNEFVVRPYSKNNSATRAAKAEPLQRKYEPSAPAGVREGVPNATSKAPTDASKPPRCVQSTRRVKIVGKHGEQAFVDLPFLCPDRMVASQASIPDQRTNAPVRETAKSMTEAGKVASKDERAERDRKAAEIAKQLREEREQQEKNTKQQERMRRGEATRQEKEEMDQQKRRKKVTAPPAMSGALPRSRKPSPATKPISVHSIKNASRRSPSVLNDVIDEACKPPSKASSRIATPSLAQAAGEKAVSHVRSGQAKTGLIAGWQSFGGGKVESQKTAHEGMWQDVAVGLPSNAMASEQGSERAASVIYVGSKEASCRQRPMASPQHHRRDDAISKVRAAPLSQLNRERAAPQNFDNRPRSSPRPDWQDLGSAVMQPVHLPIKHPSQSWPQAEEFCHRSGMVYMPPSQAYRPQPPLSPQRRKASTPPSAPATITPSEIAGKIFGINKWNHATLGAHPPSASLYQAQRQAPVTQHYRHLGLEHVDTPNANNASRDTIFAGGGWISPHPLSDVPTEFAFEPQKAIQVGNGQVMTFEEWQMLQQEDGSFVGMRGGAAEAIERRNWSRTSIDGRPFHGGQWGITQPLPPESLFEGAARDARLSSVELSPPASLLGLPHRSFGGARHANNYHIPTVVSEREEAPFSQHVPSRKISLPSEFRAQGMRSLTLSWGQAEQYSGPDGRQRFDDPPPPLGHWGTVPASGGSSLARVGSEIEYLTREQSVEGPCPWREPGERESPVRLGDANARDEAGEVRSFGGGAVQGSMSWD